VGLKLRRLAGHRALFFLGVIAVAAIALVAAWVTRSAWALVAVVFYAALAVLAWKHPFGVLAFLILALPFHVFAMRAMSGRLGLPSSILLVAPLWKEGVMVLLVAVLALRRITGQDRFQVPRYPFDLGLVAVAFLMGIYAFFADRLVIGFFGLRNYLEPLVIFYLLRFVPARRRDLKWLAGGMLLVCAVSAVFGIYQANAWSFDDMRRWGFVNAAGAIPTSFFTRIADGPRRLRAVSTLASPNELGLLMVLMMLWAAVLAWQEGRAVRQRALLAGGFLLSGLALVFSFSRSATVAFLVAAVMLGVLWFGVRGLPRGVLSSARRQPWATCVAVGVMALLVVTAWRVGLVWRLARSITLHDPSTVAHLMSYSVAIPFILQHPLGIGLGMAGQRSFRFAALADIAHVESSYLQMMIEIGIAGALLVIGVYLWILWTLYRQRGRFGDPFFEVLNLATVAAWLGCLAGFAVIPVMQALPLMAFLWAAAAISLVALREPDAHTPEGPL